jgi:hypothetical protein
MTRNKWRAGEAPTYYAPLPPSTRCTACGERAEGEPWCSSAACRADRDRYGRELAEFAAKYPETGDRLAAIERGEAPAIRNNGAEAA